MIYGQSKNSLRTLETEESKKEGFGELTEIEVKATLKKKLDVDVKYFVQNRNYHNIMVIVTK